jgi:hypothetical protein
VSTIADFLRLLAIFLESGPTFLVTLAMLFLAMPPLVLVHELGHAGAALALRPGPVSVSVGAERPLVLCGIGRMTIAINPLMFPWRPRAVCGYKTPQSPGQAALIAFAGPAASIVACILGWDALTLVEPGLLHDFIWVWTFVSVMIAVLNLLPFTFKDSHGNRRGSDGAMILAALR